MWKPVLFALCAGVLAGCVFIDVHDAPDPRPPGGAATCNADQYGYLVGQTEAQIDRSRLPKTYRIICAGCMATMDFNPDRLNIQMRPDKRVGAVRCG